MLSRSGKTGAYRPESSVFSSLFTKPLLVWAGCCYILTDCSCAVSTAALLLGIQLSGTHLPLKIRLCGHALYRYRTCQELRQVFCVTCTRVLQRTRSRDLYVPVEKDGVLCVLVCHFALVATPAGGNPS